MSKLTRTIVAVFTLGVTTMISLGDTVTSELPELKTCALGKLSAKNTMIPTNLPDVVSSFWGSFIAARQAYNEDMEFIDVGAVKSEPFMVNGSATNLTTYQVAIGPGALNPPGSVTRTINGTTYKVNIPGTSINLAPSLIYPSYTYGDFTINLGIDNVIGTKETASAIKYSTTIGTSAKAMGMHSYAYGSQINALRPNTTVMGYGVSATSDWSTVIGHGKRPSSDGTTYDKTFATTAARDTWLKTLNADVFPGVHFKVSGQSTLCTVTKVLTTPNAKGHYYEYYEAEPTDDYVHGSLDWRYGKAHGPGTFNIVAYHERYGTKSPGLRAVWINDDNLEDLVADSVGVRQVDITKTQLANGVTTIKNGYDENGAVEIGKDAVASLNQANVSALKKNTTVRNVGVAIGSRAVATNRSSKVSSQAVAVGYCATAVGSNTIAIGAGARHLDDETDMTGHNAYAAGDCAIAIGYDTKAPANSAVALGKGARATAVNAIQLGDGVNSEANTLKFRGVTIVKNGYLAGGSANPKTVDMESSSEFDYDLTVDPGSVNTLLPSTNLTEGSELSIGVSDGLRNFELYIPNEDSTRTGAPLTCDLSYLKSQNPDIKTVINGSAMAHRLPAKIKLVQPYAKLVILEVTEMDDGTDWQPVITNCFLTWSTASARFDTGTAKRLLEGSYLNSGTSLKLVYPTSSTTSVTNDIRVLEKENYLSGTFFNYTISEMYEPKSGESLYMDSDGNTWYEIIYTTVHGQKPATFRKEFNALGL